MPDNPDAHNFINEVFQRVPRKHKHKKESARKQAEQEAKALRAQKFDFLLEDDAGQSGIVDLKTKPKSSKDTHDRRDKHERHTRKRESDSREWEDDEEDELIRKRMRPNEHSDRRDEDEDGAAMEVVDEEDEEARRERQRIEDLKERDAFAERVKEKDRERTKRVVEDRSSKAVGAAAEAAERRRLADDSEARGRAMPSLREH